MDKQNGEIICKFETALQDVYKVPSNEISVPTHYNSSSLNELIQSLLEEVNSDQEYQLSFDFLINGEILRTNLAEFIIEKSINGEKTLNIEYVQKLKAPELQSQQKVEDWVVRIMPMENSILVGQANGAVSNLHKGKAIIHAMNIRTYELTNVNGHYLLLSAFLDHKLKIHQVQSNKSQLTSVEITSINNQVESMGVNGQHSNLFCTGNAKGTLQVYDLNLLGLPDASDLKDITRKKLKGDQLQVDPVKSFDLHKQLISSLYFRGDIIVSGSYDHHIHIFNLNKDKLTQLNCKDSAVFCLAVDQSRILSGHEDGYVTQWDFTSQQSIKKQKVSWSAISCIRKFKENQYLVGSYDGSVSIFDERAELALFKINHPGTKIQDILYQNQIIYCGGSDKKVSQYSI